MQVDHIYCEFKKFSLKIYTSLGVGWFFFFFFIPFFINSLKSSSSSRENKWRPCDYLKNKFIINLIFKKNRQELLNL